MSAPFPFQRRSVPDFSTPPARRSVQSFQVPDLDVLDEGDEIPDLPLREDGPEGRDTQSDVESLPSVPPVYLGGARLLNWANTASSGMTLEIMLKDVGPREVNPFKGLRYGKSQGQRFRTWVGPYGELAELAQLDELENVYAGESQLIHYGDTCNKGVTVKVMIDSGPDGVDGKHPFDGMPIGQMEGTDLYVSFVALDDHEAPIPKKAAPKTTPLHQQSEIKQAYTFSRDAEFVNFLQARLQRLIGDQRPELSLTDNPGKWALDVVRLHLGVPQLRVMNTETVDGIEPRRKWKRLASEYLQSEEFHARRYHLTGR